MPLTRDFKETVEVRLARDPNYRKELLREGLECLLTGDVQTGTALLRTYISSALRRTSDAKLRR